MVILNVMKKYNKTDNIYTINVIAGGIVALVVLLGVVVLVKRLAMLLC